MHTIPLDRRSLPLRHHLVQLCEDLALALVRAPRVSDRVYDDRLPRRLVKVEVVLDGDVIVEDVAAEVARVVRVDREGYPRREELGDR